MPMVPTDGSGGGEQRPSVSTLPTSSRAQATSLSRFFAEHRNEIIEAVRSTVLAARTPGADDDVADHVGTTALIVDDAARVFDYVAAWCAGEPPPLDAGPGAHHHPAGDASLFVRVAGAVRDGLVRVWMRERNGKLGDVEELSSIGAAVDEIAATAVSAERAEHDRWQAHGELALAKLDALLAASPAGIAFVDTDLCYRRVNEALASMSGKPVDAHIGRRIDEVMPQDVAFIGPVIRHIMETGERMTNVELRVSPTPAPLQMQQTERRREKRHRHFLGSFFPVRTQAGELLGAGIVVVEMTEVKEAQARAERTAAELAAVLDNERFLSEMSQHLFSSLDPAVTPQRIAELAVPRLADACAVELAGCDPPATPPRFQAQAQGTVWIADLVARGRTLGCLKFRRDVGAFDVTDIAVMDELARRAAVALDNADLYEQARRAIRTREEVLAIVSHDLKNPLTAVGLAAAWLHKRLSADLAVRSHVETIQRASRRMERLISDLLDMASIQAGKLAAVKALDDIEAIVKESVEEQRPLAASHAVELMLDVDLGGVRLPCDRRRVVQLLGNLLGNAIKFSPPGAAVTVRGRRRSDGVEIAVVDVGPGIPAHQRERLFEPFWSAPEHAEKGTGLGLTIAKGIVDSHGGTLRVDSEVGRGTTFRFTLPSV